MPNLLLVSTNGAGFDTVNVKDCTHAGVLVVNQTSGNAEAVATHVLAMVLMLSKQIIQTNHALRRGTMLDRSVFMGNDVKGRTIGIVGIGNVVRRVAELCCGLFGMQVIACDPYLDEQTIAARGAARLDSRRGWAAWGGGLERAFGFRPRGERGDNDGGPAGAFPPHRAGWGIVRQSPPGGSHPAILAGIIWRANYTPRRRWTSP